MRFLTLFVLFVLTSTVVCGNDNYDATASFIQICKLGWEYENDTPAYGEPCQEPQLSWDLTYNNFLVKKWLSENGYNPDDKYNIDILKHLGYIKCCGDCDDFAAMLAWGIQEYYGFDTKIALHYAPGPFYSGREQLGHAVCLIKLPPGFESEYIFTHISDDGTYYGAVDMDKNGYIFNYNKIFWLSRAYDIEWDELVGKTDAEAYTFVTQPQPAQDPWNMWSWR